MTIQDITHTQVKEFASFLYFYIIGNYEIDKVDEKYALQVINHFCIPKKWKGFDCIVFEKHFGRPGHKPDFVPDGCHRCRRFIFLPNGTTKDTGVTIDNNTMKDWEPPKEDKEKVNAKEVPF